MEGAGPAAPLLLRDALQETGLQDDARENASLFRYLWRVARHELLLLPTGSCTAALDAFVRRLDQNEGNARARWQHYLADEAARAAAVAEPPVALLAALGETRLYGNWDLLDYAWAHGAGELLQVLPRKCRKELCSWLEYRAGLKPWSALLLGRDAPAPCIASRAHALGLVQLLRLRTTDPMEVCQRYYAYLARVAAALAVEDPLMPHGSAEEALALRTVASQACEAAARASAHEPGYGSAAERWQTRLLPCELAFIRASSSGTCTSTRRATQDAGSWAALPPEVLLRVLLLAGSDAHFTAARVCVRWRAAVFAAGSAAWCTVLSNVLLSAQQTVSPLSDSALLTHHLLLHMLRAAAVVLEARDAAAAHHAWAVGRLGTGNGEVKRLIRTGDDMDEMALLRFEYNGNAVVCAHFAALAPSTSPAAGAWLRIVIAAEQNPHGYPFQPPSIRIAGVLDGPLPLSRPDLGADGAVGEELFPTAQWTPAFSFNILAVHFHAALGEPPNCPHPGFVPDSDAQAAARANMHGVLSLSSALASAAALLGPDAGGSTRDWPTLAQVVALCSQRPKLSVQLCDAILAALRPDDAEEAPPASISALRATVWATCEAPARATLLRLLRWSRTLCYIGAGRPASLAAPSPLEAAMGAELDGRPNAASHSTLVPRSYWPDPAAEVSACGAKPIVPAAVHRAARFDLRESRPRPDGQPPAVEVAAVVAADAEELQASESAWAAAVGLEAPDIAAAAQAAASCLRVPPLARVWSPLEVTRESNSSTDDDSDAGEGDVNRYMWPHCSRAVQRSTLQNSLHVHTLPMRRLVLAEVAALTAQLREPRLPGFDLMLLHMLGDKAGPAAVEGLLAAAAADVQGGSTSLVQFAGLLA